MNARRHENSNVHYNWWTQHSVKTHTSYSFKYSKFHECYWRCIPYFFVVLAVQSIVWCTSNDTNPRYIFPGGRSRKHTQYPCFCILPLEFGVNIHIRKHENSEVLCSNRSKSPKEKSVHSRVQKPREHINRFYLTVQAKYVLQNDVILLWIRYGCMKVSHRPPVHAANLVANTGKSIRGWRIIIVASAPPRHGWTTFAPTKRSVTH